MDYSLQTDAQLSSHLRALRKARGLSQAQLGALLGVGQARIARIERDPAAISVGQLLALTAALGVQLVLRTEAARPADAASAPARTPAPRADEPW